MKLIHTADWHIGRTLSQYSLLDDQRHFLNQLINFAVSEQADAILLAGDVYNRAVPSAQAVELLDETFSRLVLEHRIPVLAVAGNHDSPERLSFASRMLRDAGLYLEGTLGRELQTVRLGGAKGVVCHMLPYFTPAQVRALYPEEPIDTFNDAFQAVLRRHAPRVDPSDFNILLAHGFFSCVGRGAEDPVFSASELSVGTLDLMDAAPAAELFDYVALGHLHAPQQAGAPHVRYAGSPLKYSVSEERQHKSVTVVETGGKGECAVSGVTFSPLRDVRSIQGTFDELLHPDGGGAEDYVFATITGDDAVLYAMQKLRGVYPNILGLTFLARGAEQDAPDFSGDLASQDIEELFAEFYRRVTGEALSGRRLELARQAARQAEMEAVG